MRARITEIATLGALASIVVVVVIANQTRSDNADRDGGVEEQSDAAAVLAAASYQLLTVDHGFGADAVAPFSQVHVAEQIGDRPGMLLRSLERELIAAAVNQAGADVDFETDPNGLIEKLFDAPRPGVAVVVFDELRLETGRAEIDLHLWCGSLCGIFLTYEVIQEDGGWIITGPIGPIAMS